MSWFRLAKQNVYALRKTFVRSDIHIIAPSYNEVQDPQQLRAFMQSMLVAATIRGLDIIGMISDWLTPGKVAQQIAIEKNLDIKVLPGIELISQDGLAILALNIEQEIAQRLPWDETLKQIRAQKGISIVIQPKPHWVTALNKIADQDWAPDGIETYAQHLSGEYVDLDADFRYEFFVGSGAMNAKEIEETNINTKNNRTWWEQRGVLAKGEGENFVPEYLQQEGNGYGILSGQ